MPLSPESRAEFNLRGANILIVESSALAVDILVQILAGFGGRGMKRTSGVAAAKEALLEEDFDLVITGNVLGDEEGYELVEWVRRQPSRSNRFVPIVMVTSHTALSRVKRFRDCGVHYVIAKPLIPIVLLERILWILHERRNFVTCDHYVGPDRRFKFDGTPAGSIGRRATDLHDPAVVAEDLMQEEVDATFNREARA
jgi:DNA-binding response OmpR family regulator